MKRVPDTNRFKQGPRVLTDLDPVIAGTTVAHSWNTVPPTEAEALANIREAIAGCLAARAANSMPLTVEVHEVEVEATP